MLRAATRRIAGWGNYPIQECHLLRPERIRELHNVVREGGQPSYISRGLGRSYGDASLNEAAGVILHERLNRLIAFDPQTGVLECEAGVSFGEILAAFLPRGFFLPVTPGTKFVTVGGAIAADVHGKNHHRDGAISEFVVDFKLISGAGDLLECSRDVNSEAFWATIGGMGLTGIIQSARLRLQRVESAYLAVRYERTANLDETLQQFNAHDAEYQYSVAWIDCLASGGSLGRSVLIRGNHAPLASLPAPMRDRPLTPRPRKKRNIPFNFPGFALNSLSVRAFNSLYYGTHRHLAETVVEYDPFFYPLDAVLHWNRMYGKRGFVQYQTVFPPSTSRAALTQLLERLAGSRRASFLAVLKTFGPQNPGMLSFPREGHTLALDLPNSGDDLVAFLDELNELALRHEGRVYLAKDACMKPGVFAAMYPRLNEFKAVRARLDPRGIFSSSLARRLKIVEGA